MHKRAQTAILGAQKGSVPHEGSALSKVKLRQKSTVEIMAKSTRPETAARPNTLHSLARLCEISGRKCVSEAACLFSIRARISSVHDEPRSTRAGQRAIVESSREQKAGEPAPCGAAPGVILIRDRHETVGDAPQPPLHC